MGYVIVSTFVSGSWLDTFQSIISIVSDLAILFITLYTLWLNFFSNNIQLVKFGTEQSIFKGKRFYVALVNHTLHPMSVDRVEAVVDNKLKIAVSNEYTTIAPFHASTFSTSWFEAPSNEPVPDFNTCTDLYFDIFLSHGEKVRILHKGTIQKRNEEIETFTLCSNNIDGVVYSKCCRYLITYIDANNNEQNIRVLNNGYLEKTFFNISQIPIQAMKDEQTLAQFLKQQVKFPIQLSVNVLKQ